MIYTTNISKAAEVDCQRYFNLIRYSGGNISGEERIRIQKFAKSIYSIVGRVDFLMLRSAQNIGTGSKILSFHGVLSTIVGSPEWNTNGMIFSGTQSSQGILTGFNLALPFTQMIVSKLDTPTGTIGLSLVGGNSPSYSGGWEIGLTNNRNGIVFNSRAGGVIRKTTGFVKEVFSTHIFAGDGNASGGKYLLNGVNQSLNTNSAITTDSYWNLIRIGQSPAGGGSYSWLGPISFYIRTLKVESNETLLKIHNIYKTTIGQGLGLP